MTVVVEKPGLVLKGNGSQTGYTFSFSYTLPGQIIVFFHESGKQEIKLGPSDFKVTPAPSGTPGGSIDFLTVIPQTDAIVRIVRETSLDQKTDYIGTGTATPRNLEASLDKLTRIVQEQNVSIQDENGNKIPDPNLQQIGRLIMTDGANGYTFYPLGLSIPSGADQDRVLVVDFANGRIKFLEQPGLTNPPIPQPVQEYKAVVSSSGAYTLSSEMQKPTAFDTDKVYVFDGAKFNLHPAQGINNPPIPLPTDKNQALISTSAGANSLSWEDFRPMLTDLSSGVVSGLKITSISPTEVKIEAGWLQICESIVAPPRVDLVATPEFPTVSIDTTVGFSHFVYIETDPTPVVEVTTSYDPSARGTKVLIAEILHTHNQEITDIDTKYTLVTSLASQLRQIMEALVGNRGINIKVEPASVTPGVTEATQINVSPGFFVGYGVAENIDQLRPHETITLGAYPAGFRWRNIDDMDGPELTAIDFNGLMLEDALGALTPVGQNDFVLVPIWISPAGEIVFQYPREEYTLVSKIPSLSDYLVSFRRSPLAMRNSALIGVAQLKEGSDFGNSDEVFINLVSGGSSPGGGSGGTGGLPEVDSQDSAKILYVSNSGNWVASGFTIPTPAQGGTDDGKVLTSRGTLYALENLPAIPDPRAATWLSNGIIEGMTPVVILPSKTSISIPAGKLLFMDGDAGIPANVLEIDFQAVPQFDLTDISTSDITYILLDKLGNLTESHTISDQIRGDTIILYRCDHSDRTSIESVSYEFFVLQNIPEQLKELFDLAGNATENLTLVTTGTNQFAHGGGVFRGFDVGIGTSLQKPHIKTMSAISPIFFEFRDSQGLDSVTVDEFPSVPKIEVSPGVLADLPVSHEAFYALWIFPTNRLICQYPVISYPLSGTIPTLPEIAASLKKDPDASRTGVLLGFVEWRYGKDFSNDSKFIPYSQVGASAGGGGGLPPATPADEDRIYTIDPQGAAALGVLLDQPKLDGSNFLDYNGKILEYQNGELLAVNPPSFPLFEEVPNNGTFYAVWDDRKLKALATGSPYAPLYPPQDINHYAAEPFPYKISNFGFLLSTMTRNDGGGGALKYYRLGEIFNKVTRGNFPFPWENVFNMQPGVQNNNLLTDPYNTSLSQYTNVAPGEILVHSTVGPNTEIISLWKTDPSYSHEVLSQVYEPNLNEQKTEDIAMILDSRRDERIAGGGYFRYYEPKLFIVMTRGIIAISPLGFVGGTVKQVFKNCTITWENMGIPVATGETKIQFYATSDTQITQSMQYSFNTTSQPQSLTIDFSQGFTFTHTVGQPAYHTNETSAPNVTQPDTNIYFGYQTFHPDVFESEGERKFSPFKIEFTVELTFTTGEGGNPIYARYETESLSALAAKPAETNVFWKNPNLPPLKPGKISVLLANLFLKQPTNFSDFNKDLDGLIVHPFEDHLAPHMFLENQTGLVKWTERIEIVRRQATSVMYDIFDVVCNQDQFENWKLVIYFNTALLDQPIKSLADQIGMSLWVDNTPMVL